MNLFPFFVTTSCVNFILCMFVAFVNHKTTKENQKLLIDLLHAHEMIGTIRGREMQAREQNAAMVSYFGELIPYELRPQNIQ